MCRGLGLQVLPRSHICFVFGTWPVSAPVFLLITMRSCCFQLLLLLSQFGNQDYFVGVDVVVLCADAGDLEREREAEVSGRM